MDRAVFLEKIDQLFATHSVVAILGPRQVGKTTLAEMYAEKHASEQISKFDLEDPRDLFRLKNAMYVLEQQKGLIIIDEIQRRENLFPLIRVLVDQKKVKRKFLILGSASPHLLKQSSETLAGRITYLELPTFSVLDTKLSPELWLYGGFPKVLLADSPDKKWKWLKDYIFNFIERDIPALGINAPAQKMRQLWAMLAHYNANRVNYSDLSRSIERTSVSVKDYIDILVETFMLQKLMPWHENISKRQVKAPKILFKDTGILHYMMGINTWDSLMQNPHLGASWESFAIKQIILLNGFDENDCYYWATHQEAELDLLVMHRGKRLGFEMKFSETPEITKSMRIAMKDLKLNSLTIVHPGKDSFDLEDNIHLYGLKVGV